VDRGQKRTCPGYARPSEPRGDDTYLMSMTDRSSGCYDPSHPKRSQPFQHSSGQWQCGGACQLAQKHMC